MGVLDAFLATWSSARAAFGDGAPQDGAAFDDSATLSALQFEVQQAGPGGRWDGAGSASYATANQSHARILGAAAELDRRLGVEVDRSAGVVAAGRRQLDAVRQWVLDAASGVPDTADGERVLYPVVSRGSGEIVEILERTHTDMQSVAGRIEELGAEYQALGDPAGGQFEIPVPSVDKPIISGS